MDINNQIKKQIITHFSKVKFCISSCVALLKHKQHIKQQLQKILYKIPQYLSTYKIVEYLLLDKQLEKCENCGQYLTVLQLKAFEKRGGYKYCHACNALPQIRRKIRLNALPKYKATMKARYGAEFSVYCREIEEKRKITCQLKYGSDYNITSDNAKEKIKKTNLKKYNVENCAKISKIQLFYNIQKYIIPLFSLEQFLQDANIKKIKRLWQCKKCGNIFETHLHKTMHIPQIPYLPRCFKCYPKLKGTSKQEKELINFVKTLNNNLLIHDRILIRPYEVDILIPDIKLAIEFNGLWHHSIQAGTALGYHLMKTEKCEEKGYRLLHIWQDDWQNNKEEIKQKLIDIFENKEVIDISKPLDRCWYSTLQFTNYTILPPEIVTKRIYSIENCGYIVLEKEY